ncbi:MAG: DUF2339 domain-containing protein [Sphingomonadales bacterium]|nr:DUF2339 domain-containing protein [Sphingomonadales bacterium]
MTFLWLIAAFFLVVVVPGAAITALLQTRKLTRETRDLREEIRWLRSRLSRISEAATDFADPPTAEESPEAAPEPEPAPAPEPSPPAETADRPGGMEEALTSKWLVWIGGVALALGGGFLVKFSIDQGWLGPGIRIALGLFAAAAMVITGEWLRRREPGRELDAAAPDYVPPALSAAGVFTAYASIYAAFALYDMLLPIVAFALLAGIAFAGVGLALLHGPFLALLGLAGAFVVPLLVSTDSPNAWTLFGYLVFVTAGGLGVIRFRSWWRTAWVTVAGTVGWPLLWAATNWQDGDTWPVGLFALAVSALFLFWVYPAAAAHDREADRPAIRVHKYAFTMPALLSIVTVLAMGLCLFMIVRLDHYGLAGRGLLAGFVVVLLFAAWRQQALELLAGSAATLTAAVFAAWHLPKIVRAYPFEFTVDPGERAVAHIPLAVPEVVTFLGTGGFFAALFAGAGFALIWGARRPGFWASLSVATPLALFAIAYWRVEDFQVNLSWGAVALVLAGAALFAAERVARYREDEGYRAALAAYAVGVIGAVAFALATTLREAWLTAALAAMLPAIGWVHGRLGIRGLQTAAMVVASAVLIRLVLNPSVFQYGLGGPLPGVNWVLYGYGLPALTFFLARRQFAVTGNARLLGLLEAGTLAFAVLLVSFQIRTILGTGTSLTGAYGLLEQGLQSLSWMGFIAGLLALEAREARPVLVWGRRVLTAGVLVNLAFFGGLTDFPLFNPGVDVGPWPLLNTLLIAYALPGAAALYLRFAAQRAGAERTAVINGVAGLVLIFVWLNLEVRHAFHGGLLALTPEAQIGDAESYAYSIAWVGYAVLLVVIGIWRNVTALRYASLAVLMFAVLKVFVLDMSTLEGIWRALSFLGLGAALVGLGYLHRRFVLLVKGA